MNLRDELTNLGMDTSDEQMQKLVWIRETWQDVGLAQDDYSWLNAIRTARKECILAGTFPTTAEELAKPLAKIREREMSQVDDFSGISGIGSTESEWKAYEDWMMKDLAQQSDGLFEYIEKFKPEMMDDQHVKHLREQINNFGMAHPITYLDVRRKVGLDTKGHLQTILKYKNPGEYFRTRRDLES